MWIVLALAFGGPAAADDTITASVAQTATATSSALPAVIEGTRAGEAAPVAPLPNKERPRYLIKTIVGLLALLALAYLGGHARVRALEARLGISQLVTAGFPFVALGIIARRPEIGILTDRVLADLSPLLRLGLGWIGFTVGFRFDVRMLDTLPSGSALLIGLRTLVPFFTVVVLCGLYLGGASGPGFLREALILGTASAMTAGTVGSGSAVGKLIHLEELGAIAGLMCLASFFRPDEVVQWQLPGTAWLFVSLGLGAAIGFVVYAVMRVPATGADSLVLMLGSIAFASGMAGNVRLSPVASCFVAGVLLVNFPGAYKQRLTDALERLKRPIYLLFLLVVGALWDPTDLSGWVLMTVFVVARLGGKMLGTLLASRSSAVVPFDLRSVMVAPMGPLSIAIVVAAILLYPTGHTAWLVTAVIGGAIVTELIVQISRWPALRTRA